MSEPDWGWMVPEGRRLTTTDQPANYVGGISPLSFATDDRITLARRHFAERFEDEFERDANGHWVDATTGTVYRVVSFDPLLSGDPKDSGVSAFAVADGFLVFLAEREATSRVQSVELGEVRGGLATGRERMQ